MISFYTFISESESLSLSYDVSSIRQILAFFVLLAIYVLIHILGWAI